METSKQSTLQFWKEWISSQEAIPASRFQLPDKGQEKQTQDTFGPICSESFAIYDHATSSWKMSQDTFQWVSDEFSETWPKAGMMRNGKCYLQDSLEPTTYDDESLSWPTPDANQRGARINQNGHQVTLQDAVKMWPTPQSRDWKGPQGQSYKGIAHDLPGQIGGQLNPTWVEWLMGFPGEWTDLNASETQSLPKSQKPLGK